MMPANINYGDRARTKKTLTKAEQARQVKMLTDIVE